MNKQISVSMSLEEVRDYYKVANRYRYTASIIIEIVGVFITLLAKKHLELSIIVMLEVIGLLMIFIFYVFIKDAYSRRLGLKRCMTNRGYSETTDVTFTDEFFIIHKKNKDISIPYTEFFKFIEYEDFISFFIKRKLAVTIPKRCLGYIDEIDLKNTLYRTGRLYQSKFYNFINIKVRNKNW